MSELSDEEIQELRQIESNIECKTKMLDELDAKDRRKRKRQELIATIILIIILLILLTP